MPLQKDFKCSTRESDQLLDSEMRILVLSPTSQYLPNDLFIDSEIPQEKRFSFPITHSNLISSNSTRCMTFIELPIMFTDQEMINMVNWLKDRCFDKVVVYFRVEENGSSPKMERFQSFLRLFLSSYGRDIIKYFGSILEGQNLKKLDVENVKNFFNSVDPTLPFNAMKTYLINNDNEIGFEVNEDFINFLNDIKSMDCMAPECIDKDGFTASKSNSLYEIYFMKTHYCIHAITSLLRYALKN